MTCVTTGRHHTTVRVRKTTVHLVNSLMLCVFPSIEGVCVPGSELAKEILDPKIDRFERERVIESWVTRGHVPPFMSAFVPLELPVGMTGDTLVVFASPDVLCFGTDDDLIRTPLFPSTAQRIADSVGCVLPTVGLSNSVWSKAATRIDPEDACHPMSWGPPYDGSMMSSQRIVEHDARIVRHLATHHTDHTPGMLLAGHKKDIVLCNELSTMKDQVAIYGWHRKNGKPIQGLYLGHEWSYCDYSHGIRLFLMGAVLRTSGGVESVVPLSTVYMDSRLSQAVSPFGRLPLWRYRADR